MNKRSDKLTKKNNESICLAVYRIIYLFENFSKKSKQKLGKK